VIHPPVLSIIVPTLNEAQCIENTLQSLQVLRHKNCELIVSDGGSTDGTLDLVYPLVDQLTISGSGRARQMNVGAMKAQGEYLLFLHADTQLPDEFETLFQAAIAKHRLWGFFRLSLTGRHWLLRLVECLINWRSKLSGIGTGDQCLWVERELFNELGGFANIPLMEDIELCQRLKAKAKPLWVNFPVRTSSRRWEERGILKTILLMWRLRLSYFFGVPTQQLVQWYYPHHKTPPAIHYAFPDCQLVQFAKTLQPGQVKTRLQPSLGEDGCLYLHTKLVQHCFQILKRTELAPVAIDLAGDQSPKQLAFFHNMVGNSEITAQRGSDLGRRMFNAAVSRLVYRDAVIIVGSDCPFFTTDYIKEALTKLSEGCDCVLGPATDGGYVLIGLRRASMRLFDGVEWGSDKVFQQTIERLICLKWHYHLLPVLTDIDRPEDLSVLANCEIKSFDLTPYYRASASV